MSDEEWWQEVCKEAEEMRLMDAVWGRYSENEDPSSTKDSFRIKAGLLKLRR